MFKKILLIVTVLVNMFLCGCTATRELNEIAIAISVGIDKSEEGYLVTYQVMNPKGISSKSPNEAPVVLYTKTGKDLFQIKRKITEQSPRKMYHSHLRTVILGEELAKEGIESIVDFLVRGHEYRTDFYFLIAKGTTANELLKVITPLESVPQMEVYNSLKTSEKFWAPTKTIKVFQLVNELISDGDNPVMTGAEILDPKSESGSNNNLKITNGTKLMITNLGVLKEDKLVGWLTEEESRGYNYIIGNVKSTGGYIEYEQAHFSFEIISAKSKRKVYILNGEPAINVEINVTIDIAGLTDDLEILSEDFIREVELVEAEKIKGICNGVLKRVQEDYKTDIFGFGEDIHRAFPKLWKNIKDDWNNEFGELPVNISARVKVSNLGESTRTIFSEGD